MSSTTKYSRQGKESMNYSIEEYTLRDLNHRKKMD